MEDFGIFKGEQLMIVCGGQEKAEELLKMYPGCHISEVEYVNRKWVKKH